MIFRKLCDIDAINNLPDSLNVFSICNVKDSIIGDKFWVWYKAEKEYQESAPTLQDCQKRN